MTETFTSTNPAHPDEVIGTFPEATAAAVDAAVARATVAQRSWARVPVPERAERIAAVGGLLAARKSDLSVLVAREAGKVLIEAGGDVQEAVDMAHFVAGQGRAAWGTVHPSELADKLAWTTRQPVGVVGMITPWNFPVAIPSWKCFPALLAGNGMVLKPSEHAPACAEAFVAACVDAGIPADLVQVVHGHAGPAADLTVHPGVRAVSFTGSVATGRRVAAAAMETGPRLVSLELGGKNAMVVLDDADLELAADGALFGAFGTAGQRCTSTSRLIVHPSVRDELVGRITERTSKLRLGDPTDPSTDVGPVINRAAGERITKMSGARMVDIDGGTYIEPTIVSVDRTDRIATEEIFGPVLAVIEATSDEDAIGVVNGAEYGLSAAVYTRDINRALRAVAAIDTGIVYVNAPTIGAEIHLPFGGTKHTGNGYREAGTRGLEQFSETKTVYVDYSGRLQRAQIDNRPPPGVQGSPRSRGGGS